MKTDYWLTLVKADVDEKYDDIIFGLNFEYNTDLDFYYHGEIYDEDSILYYTLRITGIITKESATYDTPPIYGGKVNFSLTNATIYNDGEEEPFFQYNGRINLKNVIIK